METDAPDEMSREIEARLGVRRRFYERALVVFALVEVGISAPAAWLNPTLSGYIVAGCASAILGTAVVVAKTPELITLSPPQLLNPSSHFSATECVTMGEATRHKGLELGHPWRGRPWTQERCGASPMPRGYIASASPF